MGKGILKDFWIKVISVAIAIALWFYVRGDKQKEIALNVFPSFNVISSGIDIEEVNPAKIKVILSGKFTTLLFLNSKTVKLNLPLVLTENNTEIFCRISTRDVIVPEGVEVVRTEPSELCIRLRARKGK